MLTLCIWWVSSWGWEVAEGGFSDDDDDDDVSSAARYLSNKAKEVTLYTINKKYVFKPRK